MHSKIILVLSLLCLSTCRIMPEVTKWNLTVEAENGNPIIKVVQGKYTKLLLTLTKLESETTNSLEHRFVPSISVIKLHEDDSNAFQTTHKTYTIDTSESNTYVVYLGVSCKTSLAEGEYTLTFKNDNNEPSFLTFNSFTVQFIKDPNQNIVDITPVLTELPANSKALFKLNSGMTNVDDIKIKFKTEEKDLSFVNDLEFKAIDEKTDSFIEKGYNEYIGEYGVFNYKNGSTLHSYTFEIDNECYTTSLGDTFEFTTTTEQIITPLDKRAIIKSFHQIESTEDDAIEVSFDVPGQVTLVGALSYDDEFGNIKDILDLVEKEKVQYNKYFISQPQKDFVLKFSDLKRRTKYRLLIVIRNISIDDNNNYITITVGHFKGADIVKVLYPRSVNDFPAQCATWTFENEAPKDFEKKAEQYCTYIFSGAITDEKDFFKGCTKCKSVKPINNNSNQTVICVYSKEKCKSKFSGDSITLFKNYVNDLSTSEKINSTLSIENAVVKEYKIEIDDREPNKENIVVNLAKKAKNNKLTFNITSNLEQSIECNYNKNLNRNVRKRWISPENLKDRSVIVSPGQTVEFTATLPGPKHDNKTYNIYLDCYYLPNFDHQFFSTGPFVAGTFLFTDKDEPVMPPKENINCSLSENFDKLQCINQEQGSTNITMESDVPEVYESAMDDAEDLSRLSIGNQYIMLSFVVDNLNEIKPDDVKASGKAILNAINKALEIVASMKQFNCTEMNFKECRKMKKGIQMKIVNIFKNFFSCDSIMTMFEKLKECESFEEAIKSFLLLIETATANFDSMEKGYTDYYTELVECVLNHFDNIWAKFNETSSKTEEEIQLIKADLIQMLLDAISNLGEANKYDVIDNYDDQKESKGKLIISEKSKKIKSNIKKMAKMLWKKGPGKWETDNIIVNLTVKMEEQPSTSSETISYFEISEYGIKVGLYVNTLMTKFDAKYAEIIVYKKYPLTSLTNNIVSPKFVSIVLYDASENEISVKDIPKEFLPVIEFEQSKYKYSQCVYYHEKDEELKDDGVSIEVIDGYVRCKVTHFTDFSVADSSAIGSGLQWWGVLLICLAVIAVLGGGFIMWRRMNGKGLISNKTEYLQA